jgi:hypothetical protein
MVVAFQFAGLAMVVLISISFALLLEWLSLWGLMKLMPATRSVALAEPRPEAHAAPMSVPLAAAVQVPLAAAMPQRLVPIDARRLRLRAAGRRDGNAIRQTRHEVRTW